SIVERSRRARLLRERITWGIVHVVLAVGSIAMIGPFLWMVSTSLKREGDVFSSPPQWIPNPIQFNNYPETRRTAPFGAYLFNTVFVSVSVCILELLTCSL